MPAFGRTSRNRLATCHPDMQDVLNEAIKWVDFSIVEGHRPVEKQFEYFQRGRECRDGHWVVTDKSKVITNIDGKMKKGTHNYTPSFGVDIVPWTGKYDYKDTQRFRNIVYFIIGIGLSMGVKLRSGCDWDTDFYNNDQRLHDLPHLELDAKLIEGTWMPYKS